MEARDFCVPDTYCLYLSPSNVNGFEEKALLAFNPMKMCRLLSTDRAKDRALLLLSIAGLSTV